jgi:hypothetical protein
VDSVRSRSVSAHLGVTPMALDCHVRDLFLESESSPGFVEARLGESPPDCRINGGTGLD